MSAPSFKVKIKLNVDAKKATMATKKAQYVLDNQVLKDSNYYIPKDQGILEGSGQRSSALGKGIVAWNTPYARRLYYGVGFNFSKDTNPNAQALWFEAAKSNKKQEWLDVAEAALKQFLLGGG